MPRYFQSAVVGRHFVTKAPDGSEYSFIFEPVEPMGGSWLGVLAVEDETTANVLAASTGAWEITAEVFEGLKKKRAMRATAQGFAPSQTPQPKPQPLALASPADRPTGSSSDIVSNVVTPAKPMASISLLVTDQFPPAEPLLDARSHGKRKKAA